MLTILAYISIIFVLSLFSKKTLVNSQKYVQQWVYARLKVSTIWPTFAYGILLQSLLQARK